MSKREKLLKLYYAREEAIKCNSLNNAEERIKLIEEYRTILIPEEDRNKPASTEVIRDIQQASSKMWVEFDKLDKPRVEIQAKIDELIKVYNPKATQIVCENDYWLVFVEDKRAKFSAWVYVFINEECKDVYFEWNQDIFYLTNEDDIYQKLHQENYMIYDYFSDKAIEAVVTKGYIYQDENGDWFKNKEATK